jgi:hypothetical protein
VPTGVEFDDPVYQHERLAMGDDLLYVRFA